MQSSCFALLLTKEMRIRRVILQKSWEHQYSTGTNSLLCAGVWDYEEMQELLPASMPASVWGSLLCLNKHRNDSSNRLIKWHWSTM